MQSDRQALHYTTQTTQSNPLLTTYLRPPQTPTTLNPQILIHPRNQIIQRQRHQLQLPITLP
jgi:hypothetical protein